MNATEKDGKLILELVGRIDTTNAPVMEQEIQAALDEHPSAVPAFDMEKLEYISSAGLRVLLKVVRKSREKVEAYEVSQEVYDIFNTTGFTVLMDVRKAFRRISIDGLKQIGYGTTAAVYRLDPETIVKVYHPEIQLDFIERENERSRNAFLNGVPTAIAYDIVKVGDCFGSVYELLDAQDFLEILVNDKEHLEKHIADFALKMKEMHRIEVDPEKFVSVKQKSIRGLPMLKENGICSQEEVDKMTRLLESVPDRNTFLHGDNHPGNIMVQNGEFMFIDLGVSGYGHPILDMMTMCGNYLLAPMAGDNEIKSPISTSFTNEEKLRIWKAYICTYLGTTDEAFIKKVSTQIAAISAARILFATVHIPGLLNEQQVNNLKRTAISYVDAGMEPICF